MGGAGCRTARLDPSRSPGLAATRFEERDLGEYHRRRIRALSGEDFAEASRPWLGAPHAPWPTHALDEKSFASVAPLVQGRITWLSEIKDLVDWLFLPEPVVDEKAWAQVILPGVAELLSDVEKQLSRTEWSVPGIAAALSDVAQSHGLPPDATESVARVAVTGRAEEGLPLSAALPALGRRRTLARIRAAIGRLPGYEGREVSDTR
ncbi:hypothetical protein [Streptomyces lasiicapitis]|uniref:hypothetical protein n=1 Tax=Streptomyces lasiicapitis TaxID=1923961 RepID=UPI00357172D1